MERDHVVSCMYFPYNTLVLCALRYLTVSISSETRISCEIVLIPKFDLLSDLKNSPYRRGTQSMSAKEIFHSGSQVNRSSPMFRLLFWSVMGCIIASLFLVMYVPKIDMASL